MEKRKKEIFIRGGLLGILFLVIAFVLYALDSHGVIYLPFTFNPSFYLLVFFFEGANIPEFFVLPMIIGVELIWNILIIGPFFYWMFSSAYRTLKR